jgi:hypothetical protein
MEYVVQHKVQNGDICDMRNISIARHVTRILQKCMGSLMEQLTEIVCVFS